MMQLFERLNLLKSGDVTKGDATQIAINVMSLVRALLKANRAEAAVALLTIAGAVLRLYRLDAQSLWIDEGFSLVAARAIATTGIPRMPCGTMLWQYFPVHYLMAAGLWLFPGIETGARFFPAMAGILLVPAVYLFAKTLFRCAWAGVFASALVAFSSYLIDWSRQARFYSSLQTTSILAMALFLRFRELGGKTRLAASLGLAVLAALIHPAGMLAFLFMALCMVPDTRHILKWLRQTPRLRQNLLLAGGVAVFLVVFAALGFLLLDPSSLPHAFGRAHAMNYSETYAFLFTAQFGFLLAWAALGLMIGLIWRPFVVLPLLVVMAAYGVAISWFTILFHFRYTLPVFVFVPVLAGYGLVSTLRFVYARTALYPLARKCAIFFVLALFVASLFTARLTVLPQIYSDLGFTAPTAEWRGACQWIAGEHARSGRLPEELVSISPFPMFHDFYIGPEGRKLFLAHALSGFPGHIREQDVHAGAEAGSGLVQLQGISGGYLFLDEFGLNMLLDKPLQNALLATPPSHIAVGPTGYDVFVWRLPLMRKHSTHR